MNAREFFDLVADLRSAQKLYFAERQKTVLMIAKDLESKVDAEIERVHGIINKTSNSRV